MNTQSEKMMRRWRERHQTEPTKEQIAAAKDELPACAWEFTDDDDVRKMLTAAAVVEDKQWGDNTHRLLGEMIEQIKELQRTAAAEAKTPPLTEGPRKGGINPPPENFVRPDPPPAFKVTDVIMKADGTPLTNAEYQDIAARQNSAKLVGASAEITTRRFEEMKEQLGEQELEIERLTAAAGVDTPEDFKRRADASRRQYQIERDETIERCAQWLKDNSDQYDGNLKIIAQDMRRALKDKL